MNKGEKLGEGTFGIVYAATCKTTGQEYAIKRNLVEQDTTFIGSLREADMLNTLRLHPHIVTVEQYCFGNPFNDNPSVNTNRTTAMSPLIGEERYCQRDDAIHFAFDKAEYNLREYLDQVASKTKCLDMLKRYMVHILLAVEYMHGQRIIHRDLKPENILIHYNHVDTYGRLNVAKVCDLGIAKHHTYQEDQTPNVVTCYYRAPEVAIGYPQYDYKIDVWALGAILFEMVSLKPYLPDHMPDDNNEVISAILGASPVTLTKTKYQTLLLNNAPYGIELKPSANPRIRKTLLERLGFTKLGLDTFKQQAGSIDQFCNLLSHMLDIDWSTRFTVTECLQHSFFQEYSFYINETRRNYYPKPRPERSLWTRACIERTWAAELVTEFFNKRAQLKWYSHRILFQAISLFNRYLEIAFKSSTIPDNAVESQVKGLIHDKPEVQLRFMVCIYIALKYFTSLHTAIPYDAIITMSLTGEQNKTVASMLLTEQYKFIAKTFEEVLTIDYLQYELYQPTVYEATDNLHSYKLNSTDIRDLLILITRNNHYSGFTVTSICKHYLQNLKTQTTTIDRLVQPLTSDNTTVVKTTTT